MKRKNFSRVTIKKTSKGYCVNQFYRNVYTNGKIVKKEMGCFPTPKEAKYTQELVKQLIKP